MKKSELTAHVDKKWEELAESERKQWDGMAAKDARDAKEKKKAEPGASNKKSAKKAEEKKAVSMQELFDEGD